MRAFRLGGPTTVSDGEGASAALHLPTVRFPRYSGLHTYRAA